MKLHNKFALELQRLVGKTAAQLPSFLTLLRNLEAKNCSKLGTIMDGWKLRHKRIQMSESSRNATILFLALK